MSVKEPPHYRISRIARELAAEGRDIIDMSIGDPDRDTDKRIIDAMYRAALSGYTHYGYARGHPRLRDAVAQYLNERLGTDLDRDNICISPGGKVGIYLSMRIMNPRSVSVVEPIWGLYHSFTEVMNLGLTRVRGVYENRWNPTEEELEKIGGSDLTALVNPSNPTGLVLDDTVIDAIVDRMREVDGYVLADELYFDLIFTGRRFRSILTLDYENIVSIFSFSKNFVMPGFRVGIIVSTNKELIKKISDLQHLILGGVPPFIQFAALEALNHPEIVEENRRFYMESIQYLGRELRSMGFKFHDPEAGLYIFAKIPDEYDPNTFAEELLYKAGVAVSPGTAFGDYIEFVRFTAALRREKLENAVNRLRMFLQGAT